MDNEDNWKKKVVEMSTHPQHLYTQCQFCGKELPRCQYDEHSAVCHMYQAQFLNTRASSRGTPRVAEETDRYASSIIVTGRSRTGNSLGRHNLAARREIPVGTFNDDHYRSSFELRLPSGVQETNRNASSCLVIDSSFQSKYTNILFRLQRLNEQLNSLLHMIENTIDKLKSIIKFMSHT